MRSFHLAALTLGLVPLLALADDDPATETPIELGDVAWNRNLDDILPIAEVAEQPILLLFQEVPGWQGCKDYGTQVLGHPHVVEAAQSLFLPVCIYNNTEGDHDAEVRERYEEPAWNYPVVRVVDHEGADLIERVADRWNLDGMTDAMVSGLSAAGEEVPDWLELLRAEAAGRHHGVETAIFGMTWYWVGEVEFGLLDGVLETRPGWLGGGEVVEVTFDPAVVTYAELLDHAKQRECTSAVWTRTDEQQRLASAAVGERAQRSDEAIRVEDNKYYLARTVLRLIPMTEPQACRINAALGSGELLPDAMEWLSPGQGALLERLAKALETEPDWQPPSAVGVDMKPARERLLEGCEAVHRRALERKQAEERARSDEESAARR